MTVRRFLSIFCLALAGMPAALAQVSQPAPVQRAVEPATADTDRDLDDPNALRLTLDEAIKAAVRQNLGVQLERFDYTMSSESLRGSYGVFDWFTSGTIAHNDTENPVISSFQSSGSRSAVANFGVQQTIPTGGTYRVDWSNSRVTTVGGFTLVSPAYRSGLGVNFTQPLMRNFGVDITRRGITIARNNLGISREQFRSVLLDSVHRVEQAYLDLVYARQYVDVVKEALFLARDQARITQIRIDVGASAPLDILQPRVQIATTEEQLIRAVANVRDAEDRLRALMNLPPSEWNRPIIPNERVVYTPFEVDAEQAVARAFELRPEIKQLEHSIDIRRVEHLYARNQVLPRVDLALDYSAAGLAGRTSPVDPITGRPTGLRSTGYTHAVRQVFENEFPSWSVGVNLGIPVLNIGARAEARRAELDLTRARTEEEQMRQSIAVEVRNFARAIDTASKEIAASRTAREAAEQNLEAERKRYENGLTTNFQVLQVQQQLSDARAREIAALVGYNKALAAYHRAVGDLLEFRGITVDEPERATEPTLFSGYTRLRWLHYGNRQEEPKQ
ncbi:MAG TPA: TolC family protein [Thermoanaerobaculia bacterium]|nr:TolC family protein [Thermoanaerobaculia bacterium]